MEKELILLTISMQKAWKQMTRETMDRSDIDWSLYHPADLP